MDHHKELAVFLGVRGLQEDHQQILKLANKTLSPHLYDLQWGGGQIKLLCYGFSCNACKPTMQQFICDWSEKLRKSFIGWGMPKQSSSLCMLSFSF